MLVHCSNDRPQIQTWTINVRLSDALTTKMHAKQVQLNTLKVLKSLVHGWMINAKNEDVSYVLYVESHLGV